MSLTIKNINVKKNKISADVYIKGEKNEVWYEFPWNMEHIATRPANSLLVAFLPVAMKVKCNIKIDGEISEQLYLQMNTYQDIMTKWYPELVKVQIQANKISKNIITKEKKKVISCFTGGVDAFYTLIKNSYEINDLLYVWGFDIPLTEKTFYTQVKNHLSSVSEKFNKEIIFVKTNLGFEVTNKYASWGDYCYGAAIASVVLFMSNNYKLCFMPSCNDYSVLVPRGSHILINNLWGCDGIQFVYDGAESSRIEKVNYIADNEIVQKNLRVCYSTHDIYNCCECEKCTRTMASLEALNKLDKVITFSKPLVIGNISNIELKNESELKFAEATLAVAIKNKKIELAAQLNKQILNYKSKKIENELNNNLDKLMEIETFFNASNMIVDWHLIHNTKSTIKKSIRIIAKKLRK